MLISVILPVYKVENYIESCVKSVIHQTYHDFEIIVIDDGSPDGSSAIAEELLMQAGTLPYQVIHTENRGVSAARNIGLSQATGEFVVMVDSDDVLSPDFLWDYAELLRMYPDEDIYSSGFQIVNQEKCGVFEECAAEIKAFSRDEAQIQFYNRTTKFLLPTLLLRRRFLMENHIQFDEEVRYSEDVQFIWRCLAYNTKNFIHTTKSNYNYILHPGSTMTASGLEKIMTCVGGIEQLYAETKGRYCNDIEEKLVPRLYFSLMHGASRMVSLKDFCTLYKRSKCRPYILRQAKMGALKPRIAASVLLLSRRVAYWMMRKY